MKQFLLVLTMLLATLTIYGQNTSAGFSIKYADYQRAGIGMQYSVDLRSQLTEKLGWQINVGAARSISSTENSVSTFDQFTNQQFTTISRTRGTYVFLRSGVSFKLFTAAGITAESIVQLGLFRRNTEPAVRGMVHGDIFLSTRVTDKIVVGIPIFNMGTVIIISSIFEFPLKTT